MSNRITMLNKSCREEVYELHNEVYRELSNDAMYRPRTLERISSLFDIQAMCFGAYDKGKLVGYSGVRFPQPAAVGLSAELGFSSSRIAYIAEFDGSCVSRSARGQGLQYQLIVARACASLFNRRPMTLAVVAPDNVYSLINFLDYGMRGVALHLMSDGFERVIMARDHTAAIRTDNIKEKIIKQSPSRSDLIEIFASGGHLSRVDRLGNTFHFVFSWMPGHSNSTSWVEEFNQKPLFGAGLDAPEDPVEFENRWH